MKRERAAVVNVFILTLVVAASTGVASVSQEYGSQAACENARAVLRERLSAGRVILLTCTPKQ